MCRYCLEGDVLPSGIKIAPKALVTVANYALGRNPEVFERPDEFLPERWDTTSGDKIHLTHEYELPVFWAGPRLCLGKDMARFEAKIISAMVLQVSN